MIKLLEEPGLIQSELDRRLEAARHTDPTKRREEGLRRDLARLQKSIARLLTAYQKSLLSLDELRHRMPELRRREYATRAELQSIADQTTDRAAYLRLAETLTAFLARLRSSAEILDIIERQRVVRLLVKEILVSDDKSSSGTPFPFQPDHRAVMTPHQSAATPAQPGKSYLLRSGSDWTASRCPLPACFEQPVIKHTGPQVSPDEPQNPLIRDPRRHRGHQPVVIDPVKKFGQVDVVGRIFRTIGRCQITHAMSGYNSRTRLIVKLKSTSRARVG